MRVIINNTIT